MLMNLIDQLLAILQKHPAISLILIVFVVFYPTARHTVHYASSLTHALHGKLVLLHVKRASLFDPYELMAENFR